MTDLHAGAVAIGRNEGERLRRCLASLQRAGVRTVYVDSGSSDGSVALARELGAEVLDLDMSRPFSAARARNEGFAFLAERAPQTDAVLFIDGDCELAQGFLDSALERLGSDPSLAVVFGRRCERHPEASPYNRLCDIEWDGEPGEVASCGGDSLMRSEAFRRAQGFDPGMVAGEEPELCFRLRDQGWKILRLGEPMTIHDAAMTRFSQWWRRAIRAGHAYAENAHRHGGSRERFRVSNVRSAVFFAVVLPVAALAASALHPLGLGLLLAYPLQVVRIRRGARCRTLPPPWAWLYATACVVSKFPEAIGAAKFHALRLRGERSLLIEYK